MISIAAGRVIANKYRLEHPLAHGGMGSVWAALNIQLDAPLAIKFIDPILAGSEQARARFEREAKASAQLHSPNVVQVHDYGIEDDTPYICMELLRGEDLRTRLKRVGRLPFAEAADILTQAARALRKAHGLGVIHRDLKPGNVFLARDDDLQIVKVLDFGIAKTSIGAASEVTHSGQILGSPHYISPEQARHSHEADHRSDLWGLAVIAYRCITGVLPFPGTDVGDVIVKICSDQPLPPSAHVPFLPPGTDRFFERALAKDREQRFQSARELAAAFAALAGFSIRASAYSLPDAAPLSLPDTLLAPQPGRSGSEHPPNAAGDRLTPPSQPGSDPALRALPPLGGQTTRMEVRPHDRPPPLFPPDPETRRMPTPGLFPPAPPVPSEAQGAWLYGRSANPSSAPSALNLGVTVAGHPSTEPTALDDSLSAIPMRSRGRWIAFAVGGAAILLAGFGYTLFRQGNAPGPALAGGPAESASVAAPERPLPRPAQPPSSASTVVAVAAPESPSSPSVASAPPSGDASASPPRYAPAATFAAQPGRASAPAPRPTAPAAPAAPANPRLGF